jgi:hypothetical protein
MRDHTTAAWVPIITVIGYNFGYSLTGAILIEVLSEKLAHQPQRRPAVAATRAQDAAVQIGSIRPALPQHACRGPQHLQSSTPSRLAINAADLSSRSGSCRTPEDRRYRRGVQSDHGHFDRDQKDDPLQRRIVTGADGRHESATETRPTLDQHVEDLALVVDGSAICCQNVG